MCECGVVSTVNMRVSGGWSDHLSRSLQDRETELSKETQRQTRNMELRKSFAQHANAFHSWLSETRTALSEMSGTLESQLEAIKVHTHVHAHTCTHTHKHTHNTHTHTHTHTHTVCK